MRDHLLPRRHVDPVVARVADRRRRDPQVDLARAGIAEHPDDLARRVPPHDRVVDDHDALPAHDLGERVELHPQSVAPQLLARLDEGARDIAVLDEAVVLGEARRLGVTVGRRVAGVRHGDDEIRIHRRLPPQDLPHPAA